jgi:hypothetical protein
MVQTGAGQLVGAPIGQCESMGRSAVLEHREIVPLPVNSHGHPIAECIMGLASTMPSHKTREMPTCPRKNVRQRSWVYKAWLFSKFFETVCQL